ncbi:MAG: hypothetical protein ACJ8FS_01635, partial [Sphingomicrobium sp.]
GDSIQISGSQFNGLSQGTGYGDDSQAATNYPLVRLTDANGGVHYCRTAGHTSMGVATGALVVTTNVAIPTGLPAGSYGVEVVANGIPSEKLSVTVTKRKG